MMLKMRTRRSVICFSIACLMFAVVALWVPRAADSYTELSYYQYLDIDSNTYWYVAQYNFNTGQWSYFGYFYGYDYIYFTIPYNAYKAFFLVDYYYGLQEVFYIVDFLQYYY